MTSGRELAYSTTRRRVKLSDQVASLLEDRILAGRLAPGERLPVELDLAAELHVSRSVVRDAIRSLAARRLVEVRQGSGTVVTMPSPDGYAEALCMLLLRSDCTIGDLWRAREFLETELGAAALRSGTTDWAPVEQALDDYRTALEVGDWGGAEDAHNDFHLGLVTSNGDPVVDVLLGPLQQIILLSARAPWLAADPSNWAEDYELHRPILEAARDGDEAALRHALAAHYHFVTAPRYADFRYELVRESQVARATLRRWQRYRSAVAASRAEPTERRA